MKTIATRYAMIAGLAGALALTRVMSSLLYGVSATDPATLVTISLILIAVALLANEALHGTGLELPARAPVVLYRLLDLATHRAIIARCGFSSNRGLTPLLRWRGKPL